MICNRCGATLPDGAAFCNRCGATMNSNFNMPISPVAAPESILLQENEVEIIRGRTFPLTGIFVLLIGFLMLFVAILSNLGEIFPIAIIIIVVGTILVLFSLGTYIVVTNKRVYGVALHLFSRRRVDLPFDSITAVFRASFGDLCVSSPSGRANFGWIMNGKVVGETICKLLIERQNNELTHKKKVEGLLSSIQSGR
ncbi:MAG: zinc ribbon domain-containing protein [Clostridiales bacterium]|nr:zinc ribbon domain-containing protein [Clostridiales bacterium]